MKPTVRTKQHVQVVVIDCLRSPLSCRVGGSLYRYQIGGWSEDATRTKSESESEKVTTKKSTPVGLEPTRENPIDFGVDMHSSQSP